MRLSRPSPATVLAGIALFVALGGTALAATGQLVNIADPSNAANVAHVDSTGKLLVGDGSGAMTVDGTVTAQQATAANYFHQTTLSVNSSSGCVVVAAPPAGKSLIVKEIRFDVFAASNTGLGHNIDIYGNASCDLSSVIGDVNPGGIGQIVVPFDPGVGVHAGNGISVAVGGSPGTEVYVDGYTVPSGSVPASAAVVVHSVGKGQQ